MLFPKNGGTGRGRSTYAFESRLPHVPRSESITRGYLGHWICFCAGEYYHVRFKDRTEVQRGAVTCSRSRGCHILESGMVRSPAAGSRRADYLGVGLLSPLPLQEPELLLLLREEVP